MKIPPDMNLEVWSAFIFVGALMIGVIITVMLSVLWKQYELLQSYLLSIMKHPTTPCTICGRDVTNWMVMWIKAHGKHYCGECFYKSYAKEKVTKDAEELLAKEKGDENRNI